MNIKKNKQSNNTIYYKERTNNRHSIFSTFDLLKDLKKCLCYSLLFFVSAFCICFVYKKQLYYFITKPIITIINNNDAVLIYTNIFETFYTDMSVCGYIAFFISIPFFLFCIYRFFAPSLYKNEKKVVILLSICGVFMICLSFVLFYFFIFPQAINFFVVQDIQTDQQMAKPFFKISEYISTFFHFTIGFAIVFQAPLLLFGLVKFGLIKNDFLSKNRRIAIVIIFIISAIITPPDVISQIVCAFVLMVIYELTNIFIKAMR